MEEACQGRGVPTLEVVIEGTSPLMHGQLEGLGVHAKQVHSEVAGPSHPSTAAALQLPVVVA